MPRRKSSVMHTRLSEKRHRMNLKIRQEIKKTIKKFLALLSAKDIEEAKKLLVKAFSQLDKAAKKKIIHPKLASRRKSRLSKRLGATKAA
jgi:small subunit ribosomal protein S20